MNINEEKLKVAKASVAELRRQLRNTEARNTTAGDNWRNQCHTKCGECGRTHWDADDTNPLTIQLRAKMDLEAGLSFEQSNELWATYDYIAALKEIISYENR